MGRIPPPQTCSSKTSSSRENALLTTRTFVLTIVKTAVWSTSCSIQVNKVGIHTFPCTRNTLGANQGFTRACLSIRVVVILVALVLRHVLQRETPYSQSFEDIEHLYTPNGQQVNPGVQASNHGAMTLWRSHAAEAAEACANRKQLPSACQLPKGYLLQRAETGSRCRATCAVSTSVNEYKYGFTTSQRSLEQQRFLQSYARTSSFM